MNKYSRIKIAYYSGTGGTELAAKTVQSSLKKLDCICTMEKITNGKRLQGDEDKCDLLILLFAVHAFNAPNAVYRWIDGLKNVNHVPAAVISVSGAGEVCPNTASRVNSIKRLTKIGYHVIYERMIVMPSNWVAPAPAPLPYLLIKALPDAVEQITDDLLSGVIVRTRPLWIDRMFSVMGRLETLGGHYWGKHIKVAGNCSGCGWCVGHCPAGNITMQRGKPVFRNQCHFCLKCIYGCPSKALQPGTCKFVVIQDGYSISDMAEHIPNEQYVSLKDLKVSFFWMGAKKYLISVNNNQKMKEV